MTFKDVVVLIPGIGGSALSKDGDGDLVVHRRSRPARRAQPRAAPIKQLALDGDDPDADDLGDGVVATRLLPDFHVVPGLDWRIDGYGDASPSRLVAAVRTSCPGQNFFELPYDWRRDNRVAARALARRAAGWLQGVARRIGQRRRQAGPRSATPWAASSRGSSSRARTTSWTAGHGPRDGATPVADHARHALQRLGQRGRVPRQRVQEGVGAVHDRPDRHDPVLHLGLPAAAVVPLPAGRRRRLAQPRRGRLDGQRRRPATGSSRRSRCSATCARPSTPGSRQPTSPGLRRAPGRSATSSAPGGRCTGPAPARHPRCGPMFARAAGEDGGDGTVAQGLGVSARVPRRASSERGVHEPAARVPAERRPGPRPRRWAAAAHRARRRSTSSPPADTSVALEVEDVTTDEPLVVRARNAAGLPAHRRPSTRSPGGDPVAAAAGARRRRLARGERWTPCPRATTASPSAAPGTHAGHRRGQRSSTCPRSAERRGDSLRARRSTSST